MNLNTLNSMEEQLLGVNTAASVGKNKLKQIRDIVPISKWISNQYYVGEEGIEHLWSFWKDVMVEFFETHKNILLLTGCFVGSTKIPMLDGTVKTLKELAEDYKDKKFWVYSTNEQNEIVPGLGYYPRISGKDIPVYKVVLDDDTDIYCTENHPFLLRNGTYRKMRDLKIGDSLMPFYRKDDKNGYERIYNPKKDKYEKTHTIVNNCVHKKIKIKKEQHLVTHHKNYNKKNNVPNNLIWMNYKDHYLYHAKSNRLRTKRFLEMIEEKGERYDKWRNNISKGIRKNKKLLDKLKEHGKWLAKEVNSRLDHIKNVSESNKRFYSKKFYKESKINNFEELINIITTSKSAKETFDRSGSIYKRIFNELRKNNYNVYNFKDLKKQKILKHDFKKLHTIYKNHKVKSIDFSHFEDVYNISVEKYHNFAIATDEKNDSGIFVKNSLGGGKTHISVFLFMRLIYELSCYNFPALNFGLSSASTIAFMYLAITRDQANFTGFGRLRRIIDQSPYFNEKFRRSTYRNSIINFDEKIQVHSGTEMRHFTGSDLYGVIFDEANFTRAGGGDIGKLQKAIDIYRESSNRRKSRFMKNGKEFGVSIIASSADCITSFTEQEIENNKNNPKAMIVHTTKYGLFPQNYSKKNFWVFIGDENVDAFVLNDENRIRYKNLLEYLNIDDADKYLKYKTIYDVKVPEEYKHLFVNPPDDFYNDYLLDVVGSLKEVDGVAVQKEAKFFNETTKFSKCIDNNLKHPWTKEYIEVSTGIKENELIKFFKNGDSDDEIKRKKEKCEEDDIDYGVRGVDNIKYYVTIDLSKTNDSTGFALGHWDKIKKKAIVDMQLRIDPPNYPEKIDYMKIREFVMYLKNKRGFAIKGAFFDQYQSEFFIQYFNKKRINSSIVSVDRTDEQYIFLRNKIIMGEVEFYEYQQFKFELFNLVHDISKKKVDHPPQNGKYAKDGGYGKDVADAVCSLVYMVFMIEGNTESDLKDSINRLSEKYKAMRRSSYKSVLKMEEKLLNCKLDKV